MATILVVARSGRGKDYFADVLESKGLKVLKSYATRPKRYEDENTHIFITEEELDNYPDKVAQTVINGHTYFATRKQVEESDVYIIDPRGLYELTANMPEENFHLVHITADKDDAKRHALARVAEDKQAEEEKVFDEREKDEDEQFSEFEFVIDAFMNRKEIEDGLPSNINVVHNIVNEYDDSLREHALSIANYMSTQNKIKPIVEWAMKHDILPTNDDKTLIAMSRILETTRENVFVTIDKYVDYLTGENQRIFTSFMMNVILASKIECSENFMIFSSDEKTE